MKKLIFIILLMSGICYSQNKIITFYVDGEISSSLKIDTLQLRGIVNNYNHPLKDLLLDIVNGLRLNDSVVVKKTITPLKTYEVTMKVYLSGESIKDINKRKNELWNDKDSLQVISIIKHNIE